MSVGIIIDCLGSTISGSVEGVTCGKEIFDIRSRMESAETSTEVGINVVGVNAVEGVNVIGITRLTSLISPKSKSSSLESLSSVDCSLILLPDTWIQPLKI